MAEISDMMSFEATADDSALARRAQVADNTAGMISNMMSQSPTTGGFMPGIEGEGLSPDFKARTYSETDDTRNFRSNEELGKFSTNPRGAMGTTDRNNVVLPGDRMNFNGNADEFKDRARLKARSLFSTGS